MTTRYIFKDQNDYLFYFLTTHYIFRDQNDYYLCSILFNLIFKLWYILVLGKNRKVQFNF